MADVPGLPTASLYPDSGKLSPQHVAVAMLEAGFPRDETILAQGIGTVRGESGFDWGEAPDFHYNGICCRGGWQLHDQHGYGRECAGSVRCSTKKALELWEGAGGGTKGFTPPNPWEAGVAPDAVRASDREAAKRALLGAPSPGAVSGIPNPLEGLDAIAKVLERVAQFFAGLGELLLTPEGWVRVAKLAAGIWLIAMGTNRLLKGVGVDPVGATVKGAGTLLLGAKSGAARVAGGLAATSGEAAA